MIGWRQQSKSEQKTQTAHAPSDEYDGISLGDAMRGERATMGKSLLDVQRELKIKADYISAIEDANPSLFDTPGFIAGYVRSYARYLKMEPDWAFAKFCAESGFSTAHGMSEKASSPKRRPVATGGEGDMFTQPMTRFAPEPDPIFSGIEPRAVGSIVVLIALICGIGYGAWVLLQDIQRVDIAPVEQSPQVASILDPLAGGAVLARGEGLRPSVEAFDRLYRPQALEVPVMVARDAPIGTLDVHAAPVAATPDPLEAALALAQDVVVSPDVVQVTEGPAPQVALLAVRPVWVRVSAADGSVIFEKILNAGEEYTLPASEEPPALRSGNSGSLFFKVAGQVYGPAGEGTSTVKNVALGAEALREVYALADPNADSELAKFVAFAQPSDAQ